MCRATPGTPQERTCPVLTTVTPLYLLHFADGTFKALRGCLASKNLTTDALVEDV